MGSRQRCCSELPAHSDAPAPQEDETLKELVGRHQSSSGVPAWGDVAREMALSFPDTSRSTKACRERWFHHLRPGLTDSEWTPAEEVVLFQLQALHGNRWTAIAAHLPGRSDQVRELSCTPAPVAGLPCPLWQYPPKACARPGVIV